MTGNEPDHVFKALADRNRRRILDLLMEGEKTTGAIAAQFDDIGRCAVMKHLGVLHQAGLIVYRRRGKHRINSINPVPIRRIYERWMSPYVEPLAAGALNIKRLAEQRASRKDKNHENGQ